MRQHEALDRWFHVVESFPDAFVLIDSKGIIAAANSPIESLLGRAPHDLVGSPAALVLPSIDLAARHLEVDARHRDGAIVPLEVALGSFASDGEQWVIARLSERSPRGGEATPAFLKAEFMSVLMHELRTPLQTMLGWTQHLGGASRDPATIAQGLATIERNIRWQAEVLEDLIEKAQLVSGELRLDLRPTHVRKIIESAVDRIAPAASAKNIRLAWAPGAAEYRIVADAIYLERVIRRLLSNAVRFTSEGGVVAIRLEPVDASIRITVTDDGQGEDSTAFHASGWFRRSDASRTADFTRFGVALSNAQRVVEMHGGQVGAESTAPGRETRFFVTLPLAARR